MYILNNLLAQNQYKNLFSGERPQSKIRRNLKKTQYDYIVDADIPPAYAECDKCSRLYFNAIVCPNCNTVNNNIIPNFT